MRVDIYIGADRLDQFDDEEITIKSSIAKVQNIDKISTDFQRSLVFPASPNNNNIVKFWYNADIENGFDSRIRHDALIELGGADFSFGKMKLTGCKIKKGKPYSYTFDYVGKLIDLKEKFGDDKLSSLDLTAYNFDYTSNNAKSRLQNTGDVQGHFFSTQQLVYDSSGGTPSAANLRNIYNNGVDWTQIRYSLSLSSVINAIDTKYNLGLSNDFFGKDEIANLRLLLSGGVENKSSIEQIVFNATDDPGMDLVTNILTATEDGGDILWDISASAPCVFKVYENGNPKISQTINGSLGFEWDYEDLNSEYTFFIESDTTVEYNLTLRRRKSDGGGLYVSTTGALTKNVNYEASNNTPDIKVFDFFQGLIKMYKNVVIVNNDDTITVESLNDYYRKGELKNIDRYVDAKEQNIKPLDVPNVINYEFEESTTLLGEEFKELNDSDYGNLEISLTDDNGDLIDGEELEYKLPFETMVYERINDIAGVDSINFQYGLITDEDFKYQKLKAHLFYSNQLDLGVTIKLINDSDALEDITGLINTPAHTLGFENPLYSTVFAQEFNEYDGIQITNTIYTNYHKRYIDNLVSKTGRMISMELKNLPIDFIINLKLNDALEYNGNYYRINDLESNLSKRSIKLNLLLDRELDLTYIERITADSNTITADSNTITADAI